jgi:hypothetical protein
MLLTKAVLQLQGSTHVTMHGVVKIQADIRRVAMLNILSADLNAKLKATEKLFGERFERLETKLKTFDEQSLNRFETLHAELKASEERSVGRLERLQIELEASEERSCERFQRSTERCLVQETEQKDLHNEVAVFKLALRTFKSTSEANNLCCEELQTSLAELSAKAASHDQLAEVESKVGALGSCFASLEAKCNVLSNTHREHSEFGEMVSKQVAEAHAQYQSLKETMSVIVSASCKLDKAGGLVTGSEEPIPHPQAPALDEVVSVDEITRHFVLKCPGVVEQEIMLEKLPNGVRVEIARLGFKKDVVFDYENDGRWDIISDGTSLADDLLCIVFRRRPPQRKSLAVLQKAPSLPQEIIEKRCPSIYSMTDASSSHDTERSWTFPSEKDINSFMVEDRPPPDQPMSVPAALPSTVPNLPQSAQPSGQELFRPSEAAGDGDFVQCARGAASSGA